VVTSSVAAKALEHRLPESSQQVRQIQFLIRSCHLRYTCGVANGA